MIPAFSSVRLFRQTTVSLAACAFLAVAAPASAADLTVAVTDIQPDGGRLYVALHGEVGADAFPGDQEMLAGNWKLIPASATTVIFTDLPPGKYAVAAFHDQNGNGELDSNILGIPTEAYGFSLGASGFAGPPSFDDAAVQLGDDNAQVALPMSY